MIEDNQHTRKMLRDNEVVSPWGWVYWESYVGSGFEFRRVPCT